MITVNLYFQLQDSDLLRIYFWHARQPRRYDIEIRQA